LTLASADRFASLAHRVACKWLFRARVMVGRVRWASAQRWPCELALALMLHLACATAAAATTFVRMDEEDLARQSDAAVIGTVAAVQVAARGSAVATFVTITADRVLFGALPDGDAVVLREPGGRLAAHSERIFGAPSYSPGERVLAFLRRRADGSWHTTALAMGKYRLDETGDSVRAQRDFGDEVMVLDPSDGSLSEAGAEPAEALAALTARITKAQPQAAASHHHASLRAAAAPVAAPFTYLGTPSRWFEPDSGDTAVFGVDAGGDTALGPDISLSAVRAALAAWSAGNTSLRLAAGAPPQPFPFEGCDGTNRVLFNDPFDEIDPPADCRGVLGIGGYCYSGDTRRVNGVDFNRIELGKVVIGDGWGGCPFWDACGLAEVATHELGHAIGLGHSLDADATMAATARFDGRCAALGSDDIAAVESLYPLPDTPTASPTMTEVPSPTATASARASATPPLFSPTPRPTPTPRPLGPRGIAGRVVYYASGAPVGGVDLLLDGAAPRRTTTTANGQYAFADIDAGDWSVAPSKQADSAAGSISALDAVWALQASAGLVPVDDLRAVLCDVTGNGSVTAVDATRILQVAVGALDRFPAAATCDSDFVFFPVAADALNLEVTPPALSVDRCRQGSLAYSPLVSPNDNQSFRAALLGDCDGNWQPAEARSAEPKLAPQDTVLTVSPLRRLRGGRWRLSLGVQAGSAPHALTVELRYDADRLSPDRTRVVHLDGALVESHVVQPGRLLLALASAAPMPTDGRAVVVADFIAAAPDITAHSVRAFSAQVDDRLVR
jgi:hypothetical protein